MKRTMLSVVTVIMLVFMTLPTASVSASSVKYTLEGYTLSPSPKWTVGAVKGYVEGDCVPFRYSVENRGGGAVSLKLELEFDHKLKKDGTIGIVGFENFDIPAGNITGPTLNNSGLYLWDVTVPASTTYVLEWCARLGDQAANWPGASMSVSAHGGRIPIQVSTAPPAPAELSITPDMAVNILPDDETHEFMVAVYDQFGDPMPGQTVSLCTDFGDLSDTEVTTGHDGTATFTITSSIEGTATITATLDNLTATATKIWAFETPYPDELTITPEMAVNILPEDETHEFMVAVYDQFGDPMPDQTVSLSTGFGDLSDTEVTTGHDGTATFTITSSIEGTATITATLDNLTATATKIWTFETPHPDELSITPDMAVNILPDDETHEFMVAVYDQFRDPMPDQTVSLSTDFGALSDTEVTTGHDGTATFTITSSIEGTATITATLDDLTATATKIWTFEAPHPDELSITPDMAVNILPDDETHEFMVAVYDQFGDPMPDQTVSLSTDFGDLSDTGVTTGHDGTATFTITSSIEGTATITATLDNLTATATKIWIGAEAYYVYFFTDPWGTGSITFDGTTYFDLNFDYFDEGSYDIQANVPAGFAFSQWRSGNGVSVTNPYEHSTSAYVSDDGWLEMVLSPVDDPDTYYILASAGPGGSISPPGSVSVPAGADQSFTITPADGYRILAVVVDGVSVGAVASYTFHNVQADHTIAAYFALDDDPDSYYILASAGPGGSISPPGFVSVPAGADQSFTITAAPDYEIEDVLVDGVSIGAVASYTFYNVQADYTIHASFVPDDPEATTLVLLPQTGENPVGTTHNLTATVYDQFDNVIEGVAVTWNITGQGQFFGSPDAVTDAEGQAHATITSDFPGMSTVRCEVTDNTAVFDTATKTWIYEPVATRLILLPSTGSNNVNTSHALTATVYDQFDNLMGGVGVSWNMTGSGSFVSQETITDLAGEARAVITSGIVGVSTVTCAVTDEPSVQDTAAAVWTAGPGPGPSPGPGPGPGPAPAPGVRYLTVDWDENITTELLTANDRLVADLLGPSPDGKHSLLLERGTRAPEVEGERHYLIEIRELTTQELPALPDDTTAVVAFRITPVGSEFDRDIFLTLGFDELPDDAENVDIFFYDEDDGVWVPLGSEPTDPNGVAEINLSAGLRHFTVFAVLVEVAPPPASFVGSDLNIVPGVDKTWSALTFVTRTGEDVTITAKVTNEGGQAGTYTADLKLNGETVDSKTVSLGPAESQYVTFTVSGLDYGEYEVEVAGLSDTFTAFRTITWWLIIVLLAAIGLIVWGVARARRRRKARQQA